MIAIIEWRWIGCEELCRPRRMLSTGAEGRNMHNSSHQTKAEFNNCFIIHSRASQAYLLVDFPWNIDLWPSARFLDKTFSLADTPKKVENIIRAIYFAYSCISSVQLIGKRTPFEQLGCRAWKRGWSIVYHNLYHRVKGIKFASSKFGKCQLVMKNS